MSTVLGNQIVAHRANKDRHISAQTLGQYPLSLELSINWLLRETSGSLACYLLLFDVWSQEDGEVLASFFKRGLLMGFGVKQNFNVCAPCNQQDEMKDTKML